MWRMGSQTPPSRMMIPCVVAGAEPTVGLGVGPAVVRTGIAIAGAETPSAARATTAGRTTRRFAVSSGSACSSGATEPSHVLAAIGLTREQARSSVRFSLGRSNTQEQIDALIDAVAQVVSRLRKLAPAYV